MGIQGGMGNMVKLLGRRELIAYTLTFVFSGITIFCVIAGRYAETVLSAYAGLVNMAVGFYFGKRSTEDETKTSETTPTSQTTSGETKQ